MSVSDRFALLFGPYGTPVFHYIDVVTCALRGRVTLAGLSAGRIP